MALRVADVIERKSSALHNVSEWTKIFALNIRDSTRLNICRDVHVIWKALGFVIFWDKKTQRSVFWARKALLHGVHCNEVANSSRTKTCVANK